MSQPSKDMSLSRTNGRHDVCNPGLGSLVTEFAIVVRGIGLTTAVDEYGVSRLQGYALLFGDVL